MGDSQIESELNYLKELTDDETVKLGEMEPERTCLTLNKPSLVPRAGMGVEAPEQPRLSCREMRSITVGGCRYAIAGGSEQGTSSPFDLLSVETLDKTAKTSRLLPNRRPAVGLATKRG